RRRVEFPGVVEPPAGDGAIITQRAGVPRCRGHLCVVVAWRGADSAVPIPPPTGNGAIRAEAAALVSPRGYLLKRGRWHRLDIRGDKVEADREAPGRQGVDLQQGGELVPGI